MAFRSGEENPRAVLSDAEVELLVGLHREGGWSYRALAAKFDISHTAVYDYVKGRRRAHGEDLED